MTVAAAPQASAYVYRCGARYNATYNYAWAGCENGFGYYRVGAKCVSPSPPYSATIYGPWIYRRSSDGNRASYVYGDDYNCQINSAFVDTR